MKQPKALQLADYLDDLFDADGEPKQAAAELRRLHQSEREGWRHADELEQERKRLHEANQAMLEVLKEIVEMWDAFVPTELTAEPHLKARAAIAKGEAK